MTDSAATRALLEKIASFVPGYESYSSKENIRKSQRALHSSLSLQLKRIQKELQSKKATAITNGNLQEMSVCAKLMDEMILWDSKINSLTKGYSAIFEASEISEETLKLILSSDLEMLDIVRNIQQLTESTHQVDALSISEQLSRLDDLVMARSALNRTTVD